MLSPLRLWKFFSQAQVNSFTAVVRPRDWMLWVAFQVTYIKLQLMPRHHSCLMRVWSDSLTCNVQLIIPIWYGIQYMRYFSPSSLMLSVCFVISVGWKLRLRSRFQIMPGITEQSAQICCGNPHAKEAERLTLTGITESTNTRPYTTVQKFDRTFSITRRQNRLGSIVDDV